MKNVIPSPTYPTHPSARPIGDQWLGTGSSLHCSGLGGPVGSLRAIPNVQHKKQASSHFTQSRYVSKEIARMSPFVGWNGLIYLLCLELNSFWMRRYRKQNVLTLAYFKAVYTPPGKRAIKENEMCAWQAFHLILKILIVVLTGYIFKMAWTFCVL